MNILHIVPTFPPYGGGMGVACYFQALGLFELGHSVSVATGKCPSKHYPFNLISLERGLHYGNASLTLDFLRLNFENYDVVNLHYPYFFEADTFLFKTILKPIDYYVTYHMDTILSNPLSPIVSVHDSIVIPAIIKRAKKVFVSSIDYLIHSKFKNIFLSQLANVEIIPPSIDVNAFQIRSNCNALKKEKIKLLFVGTLDKAHYFKGLDVLLYSLRDPSLNETHLYIVGSGELLPYFKQMVSSLCLDHRVTFLGYVDNAALIDLYSKCDVFVLPSINSAEAFGIVILEAMSAGKAVIASNLPGVRTLVQNGVTGLLTRPGDANDLNNKIHQLISSGKIEEFGKRGKFIAMAYDYHNVAAKLEAIYLS